MTGCWWRTEDLGIYSLNQIRVLLALHRVRGYGYKCNELVLVNIVICRGLLYFVHGFANTCPIIGSKRQQNADQQKTYGMKHVPMDRYSNSLYIHAVRHAYLPTGHKLGLLSNGWVVQLIRDR